MVSERSVEMVEESEAPKITVHLGKAEKDCRICHLGVTAEMKTVMQAGTHGLVGRLVSQLKPGK